MQSDPDISSEIKHSLVEELQPLLSMIDDESGVARQMVEAGLNFKSMHEACVGSLGRTVERSLGQEGKRVFDQEIGGWTAKAGQIILDNLHSEGKAKTLAHLAGELAAWLIGLTAQFFQKPIPASSQTRFTDATRTVFQSFCSSSNLTARASGSFSVPSDSSKMDYSPPSSFSDPINSTKPHRPSSINPPTLASGVSSASRGSPHNPPTIAGRAQSAHSGILKRSTSGSGKTSHQSSAEPQLKTQLSLAGNFNTSGKSTGVRWRDVESDGEERLESFDRTHSSNGTGACIDESMLSSDQSSILLDLPSYSSEKILSNSIIQGPASKIFPVVDPPIEGKPSDSGGAAGTRTNRMKAGYLSRNRINRPPINKLDSLGEEEEEGDGDVTLKVGDPGAEGSRLNSRINLPATFTLNRFSCASSSDNSSTTDGNSNARTLRSKSSSSNLSSLHHELNSTMTFSKDRRRESLVGPIRKPKPLRRQSLNLYKRQSMIGLESSNSRQDQTENRFPISSSSTTKNEFPRRASRVPIINSSASPLLSSSIGGGGIGNLNLSRSPRKLGIRKPSGGDKSANPASHTASRLSSKRSTSNLNNNESNSLDQIRSNGSISNPVSSNSNPIARTRRISLLPTPVNNSNLSFSNNHQLGNASGIHPLPGSTSSQPHIWR